MGCPHIYRLNGLRNRLLLLLDWAWDYLFREHGVRLIVPAETAAGKVLTALESSDQVDTYKQTIGEEPVLHRE